MFYKVNKIFKGGGKETDFFKNKSFKGHFLFQSPWEMCE